MKVKFLPFIFAILICFNFYNFSFGQEKTIAFKFDEFSEKDSTSLGALTKKTRQFAKQLKKLPKTTKGLVRFYPEISKFKCFSNQVTDASKYEKYIVQLLTKNFKIPKERLITESTLYRSETEIEFWFLPKEAIQPNNSGIIGDCFCPDIEITEITAETSQNNYRVFTIANNFVGDSDASISFEWEITAGIITEGQGTNVIQIEPETVSNEEANLSVKFRGLSKMFYEYCRGDASIKITRKAKDRQL